jgi:hypothetical protein
MAWRLAKFSTAVLGGWGVLGLACNGVYPFARRMEIRQMTNSDLDYDSASCVPWRDDDRAPVDRAYEQLFAVEGFTRRLAETLAQPGAKRERIIDLHSTNDQVIFEEWSTTFHYIGDKVFDCGLSAVKLSAHIHDGKFLMCVYRDRYGGVTEQTHIRGTKVGTIQSGKKNKWGMTIPSDVNASNKE